MIRCPRIVSPGLPVSLLWLRASLLLNRSQDGEACSHRQVPSFWGDELLLTKGDRGTPNRPPQPRDLPATTARRPRRAHQ